jgi:hypothetical protein
MPKSKKPQPTIYMEEVQLAPKLPIGALRVWWIPQIPMEPFRQDVANLQEAKLLLTTLARYDLFQLENNIKPDFSNAGGLEVWDGSEWSDWYDDEGRDIDEAPGCRSR